MKLKQFFCRHIWKLQYKYPSGFKRIVTSDWTSSFYYLYTEYIVHTKCVKCDKEKVYSYEEEEIIWKV